MGSLYYDVFATVLSDGEWTRTRYFEDRAQLNDIFNARPFTSVRSCFNGMTMYRFDAIAESGCSYIEAENELRQRYPHLADQYLSVFRDIKHNDKAMICEHIAFHQCLLDHHFKIAVSREAKVYYNRESLADIAH